jgi:hypothetical protein
MENKTDRKNRVERLKRLSAQGMSLEQLIKCVMSADPKPLWEQEKQVREEKAEEKRKQKERENKT